MHQAAGIKQRLVREKEKRSSQQHSKDRLVIIPLLEHISTLLDINEILLDLGKSYLHIIISICCHLLKY